MIKKYVLIAVSLLVSLFIYLFYRTENTIVTDLAIRLISRNTYHQLRAAVVSLFPLNEVAIYSLPEGLWIFCITTTSLPYYINLYGRRLSCAYMPLIVCVTLEILQLLHVTNGRFDVMDIALSGIFWMLARYSLCSNGEKCNLLGKLNAEAIACLGSYAIVYLSHVMH